LLTPPSLDTDRTDGIVFVTVLASVLVPGGLALTIGRLCQVPIRRAIRAGVGGSAVDTTLRAVIEFALSQTELDKAP
jgi:hypothetical protein